MSRMAGLMTLTVSILFFGLQTTMASDDVTAGEYSAVPVAGESLSIWRVHHVTGRISSCTVDNSGKPPKCSQWSEPLPEGDYRLLPDPTLYHVWVFDIQSGRSAFCRKTIRNFSLACTPLSKR